MLSLLLMLPKGTKCCHGRNDLQQHIPKTSQYHQYASALCGVVLAVLCKRGCKLTVGWPESRYFTQQSHANLLWPFKSSAERSSRSAMTDKHSCHDTIVIKATSHNFRSLPHIQCHKPGNMLIYIVACNVASPTVHPTISFGPLSAAAP
jgi:hypothetical protein